MAEQLSLLGARREQTESAELWPYPWGWGPDELPEPAATAVRREPVLALIASRTTVHRLHGPGKPVVSKGRKAGIAYLEQRALQMAAAGVVAARTTGRQ